MHTLRSVDAYTLRSYTQSFWGQLNAYTFVSYASRAVCAVLQCHYSWGSIECCMKSMYFFMYELNGVSSLLCIVKFLHWVEWCTKFDAPHFDVSIFVQFAFYVIGTIPTDHLGIVIFYARLSFFLTFNSTILPRDREESFKVNREWKGEIFFFFWGFGDLTQGFHTSFAGMLQELLSRNVGSQNTLITTYVQ